MKKILIHAKQGHVVVASYKDEGVVSVVTKNGKFMVGEADSTIPNAMEVLADVLERLAKTDDIAQVAVIGAVADKVNSDVLVKEFWNQKVLSTKRALSAPELETYKRLISAVGSTYGQVLVTSQQFVSKSLRAGQTVDQMEWANLFLNAETVINSKTKPAPKVATPVVEATDSYGDEGEEEVELAY